MEVAVCLVKKKEFVGDMSTASLKRLAFKRAGFKVVLCSYCKQHKNEFSVLQRLIVVCMKRNFLHLSGGNQWSKLLKISWSLVPGDFFKLDEHLGWSRLPSPSTGLDYICSRYILYALEQKKPLGYKCEVVSHCSVSSSAPWIKLEFTGGKSWQKQTENASCPWVFQVGRVWVCYI